MKCMNAWTWFIYRVVLLYFLPQKLCYRKHKAWIDICMCALTDHSLSSLFLIKFFFFSFFEEIFTYLISLCFVVFSFFSTNIWISQLIIMKRNRKQEEKKRWQNYTHTQKKRNRLTISDEDMMAFMMAAKQRQKSYIYLFSTCVQMAVCCFLFEIIVFY